MKVRCGECVFEENSKCTKRNVSIKKNKSRRCDYYEFSEDKDIARLKRKEIAMRNQDIAYRKKIEKMKSSEQPDDSYPITGDLSRFKSSAT